MRTNILGKTGLTVSALGFGAMRLRGLSQEESDRVLGHALDRGITYFDTAAAYGDSEEKLGKAISHRRSEYVLATKTQKRTYREAMQEIEQSLCRLQTDYVDILQIHYVNYPQEYRDVKREDGAIRAAEEMKAKGYVGHIGITGHRPELLARWLQDYPFATVLFHLSMVQPFARQELMPVAESLDVGMIAMKPISGPFLSKVTESLRYSSASTAHVVLSGMESIAEVDANVAALEWKVDQEERRALEEMAAGLDEHGCRRCNYCSCPLEIRIPDTLIPSRYRQKYGLLEAGEKLWQKSADKFAQCLTYEPCREKPLCERACPYHLPIQEEIRKAMR
ncbi:aldo/keto reductase [Brevibacillus composti]|uniref:Aldo/keto reductase n=1 Tax=Brevibacillus composti TaxID=2796470 RepID=A0A7T5EM58_9BACL|nr:aldo/keto reductase [Brevibacillus composti]QQE75174.1 aldo/keto reductase [Brevibacillus composti]QUO42262.1 aldo/keto reductase [Brevibacillus composti]